MHRWLRDSGFTFIELLVGIALLSIIAVPLVTYFSNSYAGTVRAGRRTVAINLCRKKIEAIKVQGCAYCLECIADSPNGIDIEIEELSRDNYLFRRETKLQRILLGKGEAETAMLILITVQVRWQETGRERSVETESYLAER